MTFQDELIKNISTFCKLVVFAVLHGGDFPAFSMIIDHVMDERNRLVTIANERLHRIEDLEAQVRSLNICNEDILNLNGDLYDQIDEKDTQISVLRDYIDSIISG